jgi:hypothetical protein
MAGNVPIGSHSPASYTLSNGGGRSRGNSSAALGRTNSGRPMVISDVRWKFQPDEQLPKPREFIGGPRAYRAGRVSTVPLDLGAYE